MMEINKITYTEMGWNAPQKKQYHNDEVVLCTTDEAQKGILNAKWN